MKRLVLSILASLVIFAPGCGEGDPQDAGSPRSKPTAVRAVSFSPALTRIVLDLGLGDRLVGVTRYCELPEGMDVPIVGDQLNIRAEPILSVRPEVLLAQTQADRFDSVRQLAPEIRIEPIRIETLQEIGEAMEKVGVALGASETGREAREAFENRLDSVRQLVAGRPCPRVVFVLGHESPAVAGGGTFLQDLIEVAGGTNASGERYDGWKRVSVEALLTLAPDVVICQTTPDEAEEARDYWEKVLRLQAGSDARVYVVTDHRWTIPTGALAGEPLDQLVKFLHAEPDRGQGR